jgi:hypothetical protein
MRWITEQFMEQVDIKTAEDIVHSYFKGVAYPRAVLILQLMADIIDERSVINV